MSSAAQHPWVALDVATDPVAHSRRLRHAHYGRLHGGRTGAEMRKLILASWERSLAAGVAPDQTGAPVLLTEGELEGARERSPLAPAVGLIQSSLSILDRDARHIVAIGDAHANLLWVTGDPGTCESAREMRFQEGAAWSEGNAGTNALGTATALDHPIQVFSAEHLVVVVHPWTCSAAPIHAPATGELIGVVDLTAPFRANHPHTLALVTLLARIAEDALRLQSLELIERLREHWQAELPRHRGPSVLLDAWGRVIASRGVGELPRRMELASTQDNVIGFPEGWVGEIQALAGGMILWLRRRASPVSRRLRLELLGHRASARFGADRPERSLRALEMLALLAMRPDGLTAERLALELYGPHGKAGTIRALVHRVRESLGESVLATQPYRLNVEFDADWLEVGRLVAEGRPADALRLYSGPLLPVSDVPEIVESRMLLEESLRRAILTTADPELLSRWLAHPAGAEDMAAARALVAVLPSGDPRRAAATATAASISRRMA
ncbi:MAG: GAF domain-containing protein [Solirubrobacteraceae bacterium]